MTPYTLNTNKAMLKQMRKAISLIILVAFISTSVKSPAYAQVASGDQLPWMPKPGTMVSVSPSFEPALIKGLTVHKDNPFLFDFIVDPGQSKLPKEVLKDQSLRMIKYFFAALTIPDKDVWVNLSPYEKDRIIPVSLGVTAMGRDLLAQDYLLKQLTASLIYPQKALGKTFWDTVYSKAKAMYGTTQIPVNTFNKVWIVPQRVGIYEHNQTAFIVDGHLKVMLEEDYLSLTKHNAIANPTKNQVNQLGFQIIRQIILPEIEREVNEGKNFATLRQIFYAQALAVWFKRNLKQALLNQVYANKGTVKGIDQNDNATNEAIYHQYLRAYKKGVFNFIQEDIDPVTQETLPRKYFSGGYAGDKIAIDYIKLTPNAEQAMTSNASEYVDVQTVALANPDEVAFLEGNANREMTRPQAPDAAMRGEKELQILAKYDLNPRWLPRGKNWADEVGRGDELQKFDDAILKAKADGDEDAVKIITQWTKKKFATLYGNLVQDNRTGKVGIVIGTTGVGKGVLSSILNAQQFDILADDIDGVGLFFDKQGRLISLGNLKDQEYGISGSRTHFIIKGMKKLLPVDFLVYLRDPNDLFERTIKQFIEKEEVISVAPRYKNRYVESILQLPHLIFDENFYSIPSSDYFKDLPRTVDAFERARNAITERGFSNIQNAADKIIQWLREDTAMTRAVVGPAEWFINKSLTLISPIVKEINNQLTILKKTKSNEGETLDGYFAIENIFKWKLDQRNIDRINSLRMERHSERIRIVLALRNNRPNLYLYDAAMFIDPSNLEAIKEISMLLPEPEGGVSRMITLATKGSRNPVAEIIIDQPRIGQTMLGITRMSDGKYHGLTLPRTISILGWKEAINIINVDYEDKHPEDAAMLNNKNSRKYSRGVALAVLLGAAGTSHSQTLSNVPDPRAEKIIEMFAGTVSDFRTQLPVTSKGRLDAQPKVKDLLAELDNIASKYSDEQILTINFPQMFTATYWYLPVQEYILETIRHLASKGDARVQNGLLLQAVEALQDEIRQGGVGSETYRMFENFFESYFSGIPEIEPIVRKEIEKLRTILNGLKQQEERDYEQRQESSNRNGYDIRTAMAKTLKDLKARVPEHAKIATVNLALMPPVPHNIIIHGDTDVATGSPYTNEDRVVLAFADKVYEQLVIKAGLEDQWLKIASPDLILKEGNEQEQKEARTLFGEDYLSAIKQNTLAQLHWHTSNGIEGDHSSVKSLAARTVFFLQYIFKNEGLSLDRPTTASRDEQLERLRALLAHKSSAEMPQPQGNKAMLHDYGGIDLSQQDAALHVVKDANGGVVVNVDPALIARVEREGMLEVVPVIINMRPADIKSLFGVGV